MYLDLEELEQDEELEWEHDELDEQLELHDDDGEEEQEEDSSGNVTNQDIWFLNCTLRDNNLNCLMSCKVSMMKS